MTNNKQSEIIIRPMTQDDIEKVMAEDRLTTGDDRTVTFANPVTINGLVEETAFGFIAEDSSKDNKICGFVTGVIRKEPDGEETAWIHLTGVHPEYRHHKIGSRMAEALFEYCHQKGLKSVHINVNWGDASMLTWLGNLGFGMSLGKLVEFEKTL